MDCFFYKIAITPKEKNNFLREWENQRKIASKIRDEYDSVGDNKFNNEVIEKVKNKDIRPEFIEPLQKKTRTY